MIELKDWISQIKFPNKPWLVLGKGPTFSRLNEVDLTLYNTFALNHVVRELKVEIAHIIDIEVVEKCGQALLSNCTWLIMPRNPHVRFFASDYLNLNDWLQCIPVLNKIEKAGKLITYTFSHEPVPDDPWAIEARYFSSEVALNMLNKMSVKTIRSIGIDGGNSYSASFNDLKQDTLLANGQPSFDLQFGQLAAIKQAYQLDYEPLFPIEASQASKQIESTDSNLEVGAKSDIQTQTRILSSRDPISLPPHCSLAEKIQDMEDDIRQYRIKLAATVEDLGAACKELGIVSDRLGWARDEIQEYRAHILELENKIHGLYRSKTWKFGSLLTKPYKVIYQQFFKPKSSSPNL